MALGLLSHMLTCNQQVRVPNELFDEMEQIWSPPNHPVFQLTCPPFEDFVQTFYDELGSPPVSIETFWPTYIALKAKFRQLGRPVHNEFATAFQQEEDVFEQEVALQGEVNDLEEEFVDDLLFSEGEGNSEDETEDYLLLYTDDEM